MATYQLRLPASCKLFDWIDEMSWSVWGVLKRHSEFGSLSPYTYVYVWDLLHEILERHVTTYRSCGLWPCCHADLAPSPWMAPAAFCPDDLQVHCYLLEAEDGAEKMVNEIADQLMAWVGRFAEGTPPRGVWEAELKEMLRLGIGKYLYQNQNCGRSLFCQGRIPVNPWQLEEKWT